MEEVHREFRGIWIPREIWLNTDLSFQEKLLLVEIDSLESEEKGCFATNKHFVEFFGLNASRVSQIIQNLFKKGYIKIDYDYKGKEIIARHIFVNRGYVNLLKGVCYFSKGGYVNLLKDSNTYISNTYIDNNNKKENIKEKEIFDFLEINFGRTISPVELETITEWQNTFDDEILKYAISICCNNNAKNINYLNSILNDWRSKGYKTLDECKNAYLQRKEKTNTNTNKTLNGIQPEWFGKEIKKKELSDEESKEMEDLLKDFM